MANDPEILAQKEQKPGILAELPHRNFFEASAEDMPVSHMRFVSFKGSRIQAIASFFGWLQLLLHYLLTVFLAIMKGEDGIKRRALSLRQAFERMGGSFIKLGIHLSMRIDFLPWAYCNELSCMTDRMKPFPVAQAVEIIECATGKPLSHTFRQFDPDPIISTSVACTYQAILSTGEKVAVKVRRPGIGERFMSDLTAFDWLLNIAEFLTIFRPGFTSGMRMEFRSLLLDELDFIQEARRQDTFRRSAADSGKRFFTSPHVYLDLSSEEIIINEFASGIWLWELMNSVETGNPEIISRAKEMNIRPDLVAKRLLWVNYWSWSENLFFHADPNPDNVIIGKDSTLYFINFTSTGTLARDKRQALRKNLSYTWARDPQNMARTNLILLEPLPPMDMIEFVQELETYNWLQIYGLEALPKSVSWQERTSAMQWAGMIQVSRKYGIPIDIQVLRLIRSTLLLESMAVRLNREIDYVEQFQKFQDYRAEQARQRVSDSIREQLDGNNTEQTVIRLDRIAQSVEGMAFRTTHMLSLPSANFNTLMSKWSYTIYILLRFFSQAVALILIFVFFKSLPFLFLRGPFNLIYVLQSAALNPVFQALIVILGFINGRMILLRLDDKEVA